MFKHLTRIATANQIKVASNKSLTTAAGAFHTQVKQTLQRKICLSTNASIIKQQLAAFSTAAARVSTQARDLNNIISDYQLNPDQTSDIKRLHLTQEEVRAKHPSEFAAPLIRQNLEYKDKIQRNEFLLFNLPRSVKTEEQINEICTMKGVQVIKSSLARGVDGESNAFAQIQVASPQQVKILKDKFRNFWIEDHKIKLKTNEELGYEKFDHRTIIVQNLPIHYKNEQLIEIFRTFGSIVNIELPLKNLAIEQEIKNKLDQYVSERRQNQELDTRRAQKVVQDSIKENENYYKGVLSQYLGTEESQRLIDQFQGEQLVSQSGSKIEEALNNKRVFSIQSMLSQLQSETAEISKAKKVLLYLKDSVIEEIPSLGSSQQADIQDQINQNRDVIRNAISYLNKNREAIDEITLSKLNDTLNMTVNHQDSAVDPIQKLQELSRKELAFAYDTLLDCLQQREELIEKRIKSQIDHLGKEERIFFEEKDWNRELEDIKSYSDPFNLQIKAEEIISVSEQVQNVFDYKNMSPEERLYNLVAKQYNPFLEANFNQLQLSNSSSDQLDSNIRIPKSPANPNMAPTFNRILFKGYTFTDNNLERIQDQIADLRDKFDLPFDELYHKEKKLVDDVIKATKALRDKERTLPDPMGADRQYSLAELKNEYLGEEYQRDHQFIRDQKKRNDKLLNESIDNQGSTNFNFQFNETEGKVQEMLNQGIITRKEFDELIQMQREAQEANLGYAFVTFSHSDEAKLALVLANGIFVEGGLELELTLKNKNVDHKDFDFKYQMNKQRNESKLVQELKNLRESRQELRNFEQNIDKDLPSLKKLKEFRELAREVIDDNPRAKLGSMINRTQEEEEALNDKIRQLQKENPDKDYTQLFETERSEIARKAQHKKAFASYKAFQFLKHGVELQSRGVPQPEVKKQATPAPYKTSDPYHFAPVQETVDILMKTKDKFPRVLDAGDRLDQKPGRKFGYTEQDFIEAYFGKDNARNAVTELDSDSNIFGFNESYKKKFPIDKYLQGPSIEAQYRQIEERSGVNDKDFNQFLNVLDLDRADTVKDTPHPTDKSRSLVQDAHNRIENYLKRKEKQTGVEMWNTREVAMIKKQLREEYFPKPKKEEAADTKKEEKFEPFYENEQASEADAQATSESAQESTSQQSSGQSGRQQRKEYKGKSGDKSPRRGREQQSIEKPQYHNEAVKSPAYERTAPQDFDFETPLNADQRELNKEFIYDYKFRQRNPAFKGEFEGIKTQRIEKAAHTNNMATEDLLEQMKDWANVAENKTLGGKFTEREKFGQLKNEKEISGRKTRGIRSLHDFAGSSTAQTDDADLTEREDEDIYAHYMEQMRKAKLEEAQEDKEKLPQGDQRLIQEKIKELENIAPEMPRFEGFFKSLNAGKHPFEEDQYKQSGIEKTPEEFAEEEKFDEELYQRELKGRLLGENLTPRQFGLLYNAKLDQSSQLKFLKDNERKTFLDNRDLVRLMDELQESARRRMVASGEWTEEESHSKIKAATQEASRNGPEYLDVYQNHRDFTELKDFFWQIQSIHDNKVFEKEYYFDEGLGESLQEHVQGIKSRLPGLEVLVRRDREGYPIVKTQYKPQYKYNLDSIQNFDADKTMTQVKESLNDILKTILGGNALHELDKNQLEQKMIMTMQKQQNGEENSDLDDKTKSAISKLWEERVNGRYKEDREGFTKAFLEIQENATYDKNKKLFGAQLFNNGYNVSVDSVLNEINEERKLMTYELAEQMAARIKEHLYLKERKQSDFAKPRRSEASLFKSQVQNQSNAINILEHEANAAQKRQEEEGFDKEAYLELKAEIKRRREAKERLLQQGFPELKSYVSI